MKIALFFILIVTRVTAQDFPDFPRVRTRANPLYIEQGFKLGQIADLRSEGFAIFRYHFEGQLMVGYGTNQGRLLDNDCFAQANLEIQRIPSVRQRNIAVEYATHNCTISSNPWLFSFFSSRWYQAYERLQYGPVVVFYRRPTIAPQSVLSNTKNYIGGMWRVNPALPLPPSREVRPEQLPFSRRLTPKKGYVEGRVVSAIVKDLLRETYEIIIQQGDAANNFRALSVTDPELFDYIVMTMLTGRLIRLEFVELFAPIKVWSDLRGYETYMRIYRASVIETPRPPYPTIRAR